MSKNHYNWKEGAVLKGHSRRKHEIQREYFRRYLWERCKDARRRDLKLAIVDGFAGGGQYEGGMPGSPLIFADTLFDTARGINTHRAASDLPAVQFNCLMIVNDVDRDAMCNLEKRLAPFVARTDDNVSFEIATFRGEFEEVVDAILKTIRNRKFGNVLYNLDQYGYSMVHLRTLRCLMASANSVEIFLTYAVKALVNFLSKREPANVMKRLGHLGIDWDDQDSIDSLSDTPEWLSAVERLVFKHFEQCATFVSPFAINNPDGWKYWLMHFARSPRARQVYTDVLYNMNTPQAHFGRAGLRMLEYDPRHDGMLHIFDDEARNAARNELSEDIPRLLSEKGEGIKMENFWIEIYNQTPAHSDDINHAIFERPDVEVLTPNGNPRRKWHTINAKDFLRRKKQKLFYFMFDQIAPKP